MLTDFNKFLFYHCRLFWFVAPYTFKLFGFPIFWLILISTFFSIYLTIIFTDFKIIFRLFSLIIFSYIKIYGIPNNPIEYNNVLCRYSCVKIWIICGDIDRGWCDISDWGIVQCIGDRSWNHNTKPSLYHLNVGRSLVQFLSVVNETFRHFVLTKDLHSRISEILLLQILGLTYI